MLLLLLLLSFHHHHQSLNRKGCWGTTDDFATSFLHVSLFSTALLDLPNYYHLSFLNLCSAWHALDIFGEMNTVRRRFNNKWFTTPTWESTLSQADETCHLGLQQLMNLPPTLTPTWPNPIRHWMSLLDGLHSYSGNSLIQVTMRFKSLGTWTASENSSRRTKFPNLNANCENWSVPDLAVQIRHST